MKLISSLCAICVLGIFFTGCSKTSSPSDSNTNPTVHSVNDLFPLATGNSWQYQRIDYDITTGQPLTIDTASMYVGTSTTYQGKPAFVVTDGTQQYDYFISGTDAFSIQPGAGNPSLLARFPMTINNPAVIFDSTDGAGYRQRATLTLVSSSDKVTVPAGTFTAYRYRTIIQTGFGSALDTNGIYDNLFAPGVGRVRTVFYASNDISETNLDHEFKLLHYTLK